MDNNFIIIANEWRPGPEHARLEGVFLAQLEGLRSRGGRASMEELVGLVALLGSIHGAGMRDLWEQLTDQRVGLELAEVQGLQERLAGAVATLGDVRRRLEELEEGGLAGLVAKVSERVEGVAEELEALVVQAESPREEEDPLPELDL